MVVNFLSRLDAWLGKTLFHPPIILACQLTHQSQHAMSRALWFFACCHATYYIRDDGWGWAVFMWFWTIWAFISATAFADWETRSMGWFRFLIWSLIMLEIPAMLMAGHIRAAAVRDVIILFAEYAATIKTIPPRRKREAKTRAQEARI
ncbi:hypothetical protein YP76_04680 [Sphingobium chungbukense]|uniref:Uncharacterized protein n=2 Tax=Sphingobium chungbukense TaxID=56193 RepID=A0A0M3AZF5_9SPHN|nr:hypothetical protein YP76_04680 [Sphingobium chungbukense]